MRFYYRPTHPRANANGFVSAEELGGYDDKLERVPVVGDSHYDGCQGPQGEDLTSRAKHREFMRRTGLTTADDYTETWRKAAEERARPSSGDKERREHLGRALYEMEKRQRR